MTDPDRPQPSAAAGSELPDEGAFLAALKSSASRLLAEQFDLLLADQRQRWKLGSGWSAERYFSFAPQIAAQPALRAELIASEIACRAAVESVDPTSEVLARFPEDATAVLALRTSQEELAAASTMQLGSPSAPTPPASHQGDSRFRVERELGSGAFGQVVVAFDQQLQRRVALKRPRLDRWPDAAMREAFLKEARHVARLNHPGIVALYDVVAESPVALTIVMEYLEGASLGHRLAIQRPRAHETVNWIRQAAEAVHFAHERGLVHRDLKPANLLVDANGRCRVADFGLAIEPTGATGELAGTPAYMAPEQLLAVGSDGVRADIWSLGVTLYELLTGTRPFSGRTLEEIAAAIQAPNSTERILQHASLPLEVRPILRKCLQSDPLRRYETAAELAADLRAVHTQWLAPTQGPAPSKSRIIWAAGLSVLGMLVWGGWLDALLAAFKIDYEYPVDILSMCGAAVFILPLTLGLGGTLAALWVKDWLRRRQVLRALSELAELPKFLPGSVVRSLAVGCGSLGWGPLAILMQAWLGPRGVLEARAAGRLRRGLQAIALGAGLTLVGNLAWIAAGLRTSTYYRAYLHGEQGRASAAAGAWEDAAKQYTAGLALEPSIAWLYLERGRAYAAQNEIAAARADFLRSIDAYRIDMSWSSPMAMQRIQEAQAALEQLPREQ